MSYKIDPKYFKIALVFFLSCKLLIHFFVSPVYNQDANRLIGFKAELKKNFAQNINVDEREMARTAWYYIEGKGFMADNSFGRPQFRKESVYKSALRPKANIVLHIIGLRMYNMLSSKKIVSAKKIPQSYFYYYGLVLMLAKTIVFLLSVVYFFKLVQLFFDNLTLVRLATILYIIYPSNFLFIHGLLDILENIAVPLLVIGVYKLIVLLSQREKMSFRGALGVAFLFLFASLIRPHVLMIIFAVILIYTLYWLLCRKRHQLSSVGLKVLGVMLAVTLLGHVPIVVKNYQDFGKIFLSNQSGLELFQGHNEFARGSWQMAIWKTHSKELKPMFDSEPKLASYDEKQEMDFYQKQAINWVKANPAKELVLIARKTAIYFLPYNFNNLRVNVITLLTHLGLFGFVLFSLWKRWRNQNLVAYLIVLAPILGSYILSILFFVGYRWRFYAEPFMLILAICFYVDMWQKLLPKAKKADV